MAARTGEVAKGLCLDCGGKFRVDLGREAHERGGVAEALEELPPRGAAETLRGARDLLQAPPERRGLRPRADTGAGGVRQLRQ
ncbi:MAG: hypothetical protein IJ678_02290 [Kiritimatiellae bacterium]|nr:hypothetical protein [Kiritimatiellia bacterium]